MQPVEGSQMLSYKPPAFVFNRNYGWYGTAGVGEGEFDANRAARGYDWCVPDSAVRAVCPCPSWDTLVMFGCSERSSEIGFGVGASCV